AEVLPVRAWGSEVRTLGGRWSGFADPAPGRIQGRDLRYVLTVRPLVGLGLGLPESKVAAHEIVPPDIQTTSDLQPTLHPDAPDLLDPPFTSGPRSTSDLCSESSATRLGLHRRRWHRGWRGCSRHGWWSVTVVVGRCRGPASPEERIQPAWGALWIPS
ncbi:hypothetical protein U1Q18_020989, partial [Sarracenia purpurea var. burkii]